MLEWQRFVLTHGWKADGYELAAVLGRTKAEVLKFRGRGLCSRGNGKVKRFAALFALWRGRPPRDDEWPRPRKAHRGCYEWQAPELALLASLVGRVGYLEISRILTRRLRKVTGDRRTVRSLAAVQISVNHRLGMVSTDVVGGITIAEAGRELGSRAVIYQCIRAKQLRPFRVGRLWVIPREKWEAWKKTRSFPPKGYVQLSTLKRPLGINSDKLSEWARMGYMPTAVRCNPFGLGIKSTQFGTWFVDPKVARKLVADRRAGRPMPWWGHPDPGNLRITWKLLQRRQHPPTCRTCAQIWGGKGAPVSYEDYAVRYPPLAHGAKRHLTRKWSPGLTIEEVATFSRRSWTWVRRAIDNGTLSATRTGWRFYITRSDATHWKARRCPAGCHESSWTSLASAKLQHRFSLAELRAFIREGKLRSMVGTNGPMRGITYVSRHQVRHLREKIGFTEEQAAHRVGVRVPRLRKLLKGVDWRGTGAIPLDTVNAVIKRRYSQDGGCTIEEAAAKLGESVKWIHERKLDGTIRVLRGKWDRRRLYITPSMLERLRLAKRQPKKRERFGPNWLLMSRAAVEAGVSNATLIRWAEDGELERRQSLQGWRYHRRAVRARARRYWKDEVRLRRAIAPDWMPAHQVLTTDRLAAITRGGLPLPMAGA